MIGKELLTKYVLPFELISVILLAALVGSAAISKKNDTFKPLSDFIGHLIFYRTLRGLYPPQRDRDFVVFGDYAQCRKH